MAHHGHQLCLARPRGEPCPNSRETQHPHMQELTKCICFDCDTQLMVRREAALLTAQGVPLISANSAWRKFQGLGFDYEHPDGSDLCALCTQPADGEPMLKCCGLRDGEACKHSWHVRCHEAVSELVGGTAAPPQDGVLQCCAGWPAREAIDPRDRLRVGHTSFRKDLARPGQRATRGATAQSSAATAVDPSAADADADDTMPGVAPQPPATPPSSSSAPPSSSLLTPHTSAGEGGAGVLRPRLPEAAGAALARESTRRVDRPPACGGGIDWEATGVDGSRRLGSGAQSDVFEATVSTARFGSFSYVWRLGNDDRAAATPGQKLAVKTPKPVTEPAGDDESATRANELLRWEARTPLIYALLAR